MWYLFSLVGFYSVLPVCNPYQSAAFRYVVYVMPATTESKWPALEDLGFDKSEAGRLSEKPTVGHRINRPAHPRASLTVDRIYIPYYPPGDHFLRPLPPSPIPLATISHLPVFPSISFYSTAHYCIHSISLTPQPASDPERLSHLTIPSSLLPLLALESMVYCPLGLA